MKKTTMMKKKSKQFSLYARRFWTSVGCSEAKTNQHLKVELLLFQKTASFILRRFVRMGFGGMRIQ